MNPLSLCNLSNLVPASTVGGHTKGEDSPSNIMDYIPFSAIDLDNPFFDSLKADYKEFETWFKKKKDDGSKAYIEIEQSTKEIVGFLYVKVENEELKDVEPVLPARRRIKAGTFKVNAHGTKYGERFIKKIMDHALAENAEEVYLTVFSKHEGLIALISRYGFIPKATKTTPNGIEQVYVKNMKLYTGNILLDYPLIKKTECKKYLLSIYPKYHTRLFPDSILNNESYDVVQDISPTNSIHKIYICYMYGCASLKPKDLLLIYRTSDGQGPAKYRSVVTSVCEVQELKTRHSFKDMKEFIEYSSAYSIFVEKELKAIWEQTDPKTKKLKQFYVIKMIYNAAFGKRVINDELKRKYGIGTAPGVYWGFIPLTDEQFQNVLKGGNVNENIIVD